MWFAEYRGNQVGKVDALGNCTLYTIPTSNSYPYSIETGPDGAIWFAEYQGNKIGRITTTGIITEYAIPNTQSAIGTNSLINRFDGGIWFANSQGYTGRIDPATGTIVEYDEPGGNGSPSSLTLGSDGALWYTDFSSNSIGRFYPTLINNQYSAPISTKAHEDFSGQIAAFHDGYNPTTDTNLQAEIEWGDGQTSLGTINSIGAGDYTITGSNTYTSGATLPITVTIIDGSTEEDVMDGDPNGFQIDNTAMVADAGTLNNVNMTQNFTPDVGSSGFETPNVGTNTFGSYAYDPTGSDWTYGGQSGVAGNGSEFTSSNPNSPEGTQVAFLQGSGSFGQFLAGWAAGTYQLSFLAAYRPGYGSRQDFQVLIDGNLVGTFATSDSSYQSYWTSAFTLSAGTHSILFRGLDSAGGDNTAFIDSISLADATPQSPVQTIANAGFEQNLVGDNNYVYDPSGAAWTFSGSTGVGSGDSSNGSAFTAGNPPAPEGAQVAFIQSTGSITQSMASWAAGSYTLSFQAAQRGNDGTSVEDFEILIDGSVVGTFQPTDTTYRPYSTSPFSVSAGSHTIEFLGLNTAGGDNTAFLDEIAATPNSGGPSAGPAASGPTINVSDAAPFDGMVAEFTDSDPYATPDKYATSIDFGDGGGPQEGYVLADPNGGGLFDVYGDYDFLVAGKDSGTATITETGGTTLAMNFVTDVAEGNTETVADVPRITITSRGSHQGDGKTITDFEGMKYTVGRSISVPVGNNTNSTRYILDAVNWSYPSSSVKGYGRFSTNPTTGSERFIGQPNDDANTTVKAVTSFTAGEQGENNRFSQGGSPFINTFYWGPESTTGVQTISVTALFTVYVNNVAQSQQYSYTDSVQVNVVEPTAVRFAFQQFGQPGLGIPNYSGPANPNIGTGSQFGVARLVVRHYRTAG